MSTQEHLRFPEMCRVWALGSQRVQEVARARARALLARAMGKPQEERERRWRSLGDSSWIAASLGSDRNAWSWSLYPKSADWKIAIVAGLKALTTTSNAWLADELQMGLSTAPSRYVGETKQ